VTPTPASAKRSRAQAPAEAPTLQPLDSFKGDDEAGHRSNADFARGKGAGAAAASDAAALSPDALNAQAMGMTVQVACWP
jgi:hypothetical protein